MKLENQVCLLEQAKELKELIGPVAFSLFRWLEFKKVSNGEVLAVITYGGIGNWPDRREWRDIGSYPALTATELYHALNCDEYNSELESFATCDPDLMANDLLYLLNKGKISADEVNERLNNA